LAQKERHVRPEQYFLPPVWIARRGLAQTLARPPGKAASLAKVRVMVKEALAAGDKLIKALRESTESYGPTKGDADD
jgi:hypothetical protein